MFRFGVFKGMWLGLGYSRVCFFRVRVFKGMFLGSGCVSLGAQERGVSKLGSGQIEAFKGG